MAWLESPNGLGAIEVSDYVARFVYWTLVVCVVVIAFPPCHFQPSPPTLGLGNPLGLPMPHQFLDGGLGDIPLAISSPARLPWGLGTPLGLAHAPPVP